MDENGEQLGVMPTLQAKNLARQKGLDLIEVAPMAKPPVCRIMDHGQYKYQLNKREKEQRKQVKALKEIRLRPRIFEHDLETKMRRAETFLTAGHRVRMFMIFRRGRERGLMGIGREKMMQIGTRLKEVATVEMSPSMRGNIMAMTLVPTEATEEALKKAAQAKERDKEEKPQSATKTPTSKLEAVN